MLDKSLLEILVCPSCRSSLKEEEERLICPQCDRLFPIRNGVPVLIIEPGKK